MKMAKHSIVNTLVSVLIILLAINILMSTMAGKEFSKKLDNRIESMKPAEISIIKISSDCSDCSDISSAVNILKSGNVKILDEKEVAYKDAADLINEYNIERLPTFIVKGNSSKLSTQGFEKVNDALVFKNNKAPYFNTKNSMVEGLVSLRIIKEESCKECTDLSILKTQLESIGVKIKEFMTLNKNEAKDLISEYGISKLPTILVSKDLSAYEISKIWSNVGIINQDGTFVMTKTSPPYYDLTDNKVKGLIKLDIVYDKNCLECQDKSLQESALKSLGISFISVNVYDINENQGRDSIKKYAITQIPASIMSPDVSVYEGLDEIWQQVGTIEQDGSYVLRKADLFGSYKDLKTGEVVKKELEQ